MKKIMTVNIAAGEIAGKRRGEFLGGECVTVRVKTGGLRFGRRIYGKLAGAAGMELNPWYDYIGGRRQV